MWSAQLRHRDFVDPVGRRIAFQAGTDGTRVGARIAFKDVETVGDPVISDAVTGPGRVSPSSWSPDGRSLAYVIQSTDTGLDIGVLDVATNASRLLLNTNAQETRPEYSPDGRWLAYQSNESGRFEVFVTDAAASTLKHLGLDRLDVIHIGTETYPLDDRVRAVAFDRLQHDVTALR